MITTSSPSRNTPLKATTNAGQSRPGRPRLGLELTDRLGEDGVLVVLGLAARRPQHRLAQPVEARRRGAGPPTTTRSASIGTQWTTAGPTAATPAPSTTTAAPAPSRAQRHPRETPTATTMVSASTISTAQATKTAANRTPPPVCTVPSIPPTLPAPPPPPPPVARFARPNWAFGRPGPWRAEVAPPGGMRGCTTSATRGRGRPGQPGPGARVLPPRRAALVHPRFPGGPTAPQTAAWPLIATGRDVLVASPTGTGKTLTGFLVAIDAAYRRRRGASPTPSGPPRGGLRLAAPGPGRRRPREPPGPAGRHRARPRPGSGWRLPDLSVAVRTGDTPPAERAAMRRRAARPVGHHARVALPAAHRARRRGPMLRRVRTVIVDEVHTLARDKRGAHLALSLERLAHLVEPPGGRLQRIGLSATQRPLEVVARLLGGAGPGRPLPGHRRLRAPPATSTWPSSSPSPSSRRWPATASSARCSTASPTRCAPPDDARLRQHPQAGRAGRPPAGRAARRRRRGAAGRPAASWWPPTTAASRRPAGALVEARLRAGDLRALVATASLELGIDVGPVELVCQIGSPAGHRHVPPAGRAGQPPAATAPRPVVSTR